MGIVCVGALGELIAQRAQVLGMSVSVAERKGDSPRENRTSFEGILRQSTVLVMCLPRNSNALNLVSTTELRMIRPQALLINVA